MARVKMNGMEPPRRQRENMKGVPGGACVWSRNGRTRRAAGDDNGQGGEERAKETAATAAGRAAERAEEGR